MISDIEATVVEACFTQSRWLIRDPSEKKTGGHQQGGKSKRKASMDTHTPVLHVNQLYFAIRVLRAEVGVCEA